MCTSWRRLLDRDVVFSTASRTICSNRSHHAILWLPVGSRAVRVGGGVMAAFGKPEGNWVELLESGILSRIDQALTEENFARVEKGGLASRCAASLASRRVKRLIRLNLRRCKNGVSKPSHQDIGRIFTCISTQQDKSPVPRAARTRRTKSA